MGGIVMKYYHTNDEIDEIGEGLIGSSSNNTSVFIAHAARIDTICRSPLESS